MPVKIYTGAEAVAAVVGTPINIVLYGPNGIEKTTDAVSLFLRDGRCTAFVIPAEDGALKGPAARGMPIPDCSEPVKSWAAMYETLLWVAHNRQHYNGVIIDGLSAFSTYLYNEATASNPKNKFDVPVMVSRQLILLRDLLRQLGLHAIYTAHEEPPAVKEGVFYPGSMKLQPRTMVRDYNGMIDTVIRVGRFSFPGRPTLRVYFPGGNIWPAELGPMPPQDLGSWLVKNREGCNYSCVPADLPAFVRARQPPYQGL